MVDKNYEQCRQPRAKALGCFLFFHLPLFLFSISLRKLSKNLKIQMLVVQCNGFLHPDIGRRPFHEIG